MSDEYVWEWKSEPLWRDDAPHVGQYNRNFLSWWDRQVADRIMNEAVDEVLS